MFGRPSLDNDAVAAARRRLAAVAAQFERTDVADVADGEGLLNTAPEASKRKGANRIDVPPVAMLRASSRLPGQSGPARPGRHRDDGHRHPFAHWRLRAPHVTLAALVVAALIAIAAWWALRSVPDPQPVPVASERSVPAAQPSEPSPGAPSVSTPSGGAPDPNPGATSAQLVVDVTGKVRNAGIVELAAGSRVVDALQAAGGARHGVDTADLNLARQLVDGEQIVVGRDVPTIGSGPSAPATASSSDPGQEIAPVNINTADQAQLETLPGIGPVTAESILAWRSDNGSFSSVDELLEVSGIGDAIV
ncbi:MAG: ComEA family DNA-binding protein [Nocardioidaceae bacterium]